MKPVAMRGIKSFAMVLCVSSASSLRLSETRTDMQRLTSSSQASSAEGKEGGIEFVQPPAASKPGERIYFEGAKYESQYPSRFKPFPQ